jgi:hypothetical protein
MWILVIIIIIGLVYYVTETYGHTNDDKGSKKGKEAFEEADSDSESDKKKSKKKGKKKEKETFEEAEEDSDSESDRKKTKKKEKEICIGSMCLPKDRIQDEISDMDEGTKQELIKMLKK